MDKPRLVAIIQARMTSSRLPGKVLKPLLGKTLLERMLERVKQTVGIDQIIVAIPEGAIHDPLMTIISMDKDILGIRGDEHDVLARYYKAALASNANIILRLTSDCPLYDFKIMTQWIQLFKNMTIDYMDASQEKGYPLGLLGEIIRFKALERAYHDAKDPYEREHVTPYIWRRPELFSALYMEYAPDLRSWRCTIDEEKDYQLVKEIFALLYPQNPSFGFEDIVTLLRKKPSLLEMNKDVRQKPLMKMTS